MSLDFYTDMDGRRCILVDGCSETPLPMPSFSSIEDAESFTQWCISVHGKDPRRFNAKSLEYLRDAWHELPKCDDCRRVLDEGRCEDCGDDTDSERKAV